MTMRLDVVCSLENGFVLIRKLLSTVRIIQGDVISPTILVFGANVCGWWVRKVVVDYTMHQASYCA